MKKIGVYILVCFLLLGCVRNDLFTPASQTAFQSSFPTALGEPFEWDDTDEDVIFLNLLETCPVQQCSYVPISGPLLFYFDDNIKTETLNASTVKCDSIAVSEYKYIIEHKCLEIVLASPLAYDTDYCVTLTTGILSVAEGALENEYALNFRTLSANTPLVQIDKVESSPVKINPGTTVNLGYVDLSTTVSKDFNMKNTGTGDLVLTSIDVVDASGYFTLADPAYTIVPGDLSTFTIGITPTTEGTYIATYSVLSNAANITPFVFYVSATAIATPQPSLQLSVPGESIIYDGGSYDFGSVVVGESSYTADFTIKNIGTDDLEISLINITGKSEFLFGGSSLENITVVPQDSYVMPISFSPDSKGNKKCYMEITSNDPDVPFFSITLKGRGI